MAKKLVHVLIAKSILDTIFVGVIAVVIYARAFPPTFHGWGEAVVETQSIAGWAVDAANPSRNVEVYMFIDGWLAGTGVAKRSRPDIVTAGWAKDEWHGYEFYVSALSQGPHEARVYALHQNGDRYTLQILGDPIKFQVDGDKWRR